MARGVRRLRSSILVGLLAMVLVPTIGSLTASTTEAVEITSTRLTVEQIVIKTMKPYPEVKAGVEKLGRLDDSVALLTKTDIEDPEIDAMAQSLDQRLMRVPKKVSM